MHQDPEVVLEDGEQSVGMESRSRARDRWQMPEGSRWVSWRAAQRSGREGGGGGIPGGGGARVEAKGTCFCTRGIALCVHQNIIRTEFPLWRSGHESNLGTMRFRVQSLASLSGLRIRCCHELWYWLQTWLRSCVAVAVA